MGIFARCFRHKKILIVLYNGRFLARAGTASREGGKKRKRVILIKKKKKKGIMVFLLFETDFQRERHGNFLQGAGCVVKIPMCDLDTNGKTRVSARKNGNFLTRAG